MPILLTTFQRLPCPLGRQNYSYKHRCTAWLVVLEKKGLHQAAGILESYGIDSETDVSLLDRDDFSKLSSNGLKPMEGKKLERWCTAVRAPAQNMLTSAALLSSEALNVLTLSAHSDTMAECVSDNDSERDGEDDDQRMTWRSWVNSQVLRTVHALYQEGTKRRPRRPRQRSLKSKRHLPNFVASKIDKTRKINLRHVSGRGGSMKKQGARKNDVKPDTLKKRLLDFPGQFFQVQGRQLYCGACCTNVGSCKSDASQHCKPMQHTTKVQLLFLRQFRSFVQNFCKRCCVRA